MVRLIGKAVKCYRCDALGGFPSSKNEKGSAAMVEEIPPLASKTNLRRSYADLLIKIIANTIYEDPSMDPWRPKTFDAATRSVGNDWPRTAHSMVGIARLENLRDLTMRVLDEQVPGDLIETGVWRGGCCILMKGILHAFEDATRRVFVADSFAGLPSAEPDKYKDPASDAHHTFTELIVPIDVVRENFRRYGFLDDRVVFVEGFFDDTLPNLKAGVFSLLRLDGDMYGSTIVALDNLYPKLSPGGYIIIDDFGAVEGCREAVKDYRNAHSITAEVHKVDWTGIWWQKPS